MRHERHWSAIIIGHAGNALQRRSMQRNEEQCNANILPPNNWVWYGSLDFLGPIAHPSAQHSNVLFWNFLFIHKSAFAARKGLGTLHPVMQERSHQWQCSRVPGQLIADIMCHCLSTAERAPVVQLRRFRASDICGPPKRKHTKGHRCYSGLQLDKET